MDENNHILIVDDEKSIHDDFIKILSTPDDHFDDSMNEIEKALFNNKGSAKREYTVPEYKIDHAYNGEEALQMIEKVIKQGNPYAVVFMDVRMPPGIDGIETIYRLWEKYPNTEVIICTAYSDYSWDEIVNKLGTTDRLLFLKKPFYSIEVKQIALALIKKWNLNKQNIELINNLKYFNSLAENEVENLTIHISQKEIEMPFNGKNITIYKSKIMQEVIIKVNQAKIIRKPVLITGETGTGKELIARMLHQDNGPFIALNCAAITATLWEEELFGHKKGAFTDAHSNRTGEIAKADNGTLFFDEIGEIPIEIQAKLLRLIQENQYKQIGGDTIIKSQCRFVFATNKNIETVLKDGSFREDLYYRISTFPIHLPPLRERKEDIPLLLENWPGNIRELENVIIRSLANMSCSNKKEKKDIITIKELPAFLINNVKISSPVFNEFQITKLEEKKELFDIEGRYDNLILNYSKRILNYALKIKNGNKKAAAEMLGMKRTTFCDKLKE